MKRQIEVVASFTGKISTGSFENESPYLSAKETFEVEDMPTGMLDELIATRQDELKAICYEGFKRHANLAYQEKVAKEYKQIRFYESPSGKKYPSVTSCLNMDTDFFMSVDDLAQYSARGTILHKQSEIFLKTGKWLLPREIPEVAFELMTMTKGTLGLSLEDVNFPNFYKSYPFKVIEQEKVVINEEFEYAGRLDILCVIESSNKGSWDKIEGIQFDVPTILDIKSGSIDKVKCYSQQAAYAKCYPEVKQIGLIPLTKDTQQGFSKPLITNKIDAYWDIFSKQREKFRGRFGL